MEFSLSLDPSSIAAVTLLLRELSGLIKALHKRDLT